MKTIRYFVALLWLVSLTLGIRYVVGSPKSFGEQQYLEYTQVIISASLLASLIVIIIFHKQLAGTIKGAKNKIPALLVICAVLFSGVNANFPLQTLWWIFVTATIIVAGITVFGFVQPFVASGKHLLFVVVLLSSLESIVGILQFTLGHSLGLSFLGEIQANDSTFGVAKLIINGSKLLRPMGTFLHANIFAGFLLVGITATILLATTKRTRGASPTFQVILGVQLIALFVSYSRTAWISLVLLLGYFIINGNYVWRFIRIPLFALLLAIVVGFPGVMSRFTISEQKPQLAIRYISQSWALESIHSHPVVGVGFHNLVPNNAMRPVITYAVQPPHNSFLYLLAEIGLIGATTIIYLIWTNGAISTKSSYISPAVIILFGVGPALLFDHYLISMVSGIGIFVIFVIVAKLGTSINKNVPRGTFSTNN